MAIDDAAPRPRGTGPGPITPDGCAVDLYAALPPRDEPAIVGGAVPTAATILELGCGAGRLTRPLLAAGYRVTAVDESAEMLDRLPVEVERVRSTIEALDLGRRFDAVLLASHLVNTPDAGQRHRLLDCCARHVAPGGVVLIERHPPGWVATVTDTEGSDGALATSLRVLGRPAPGLVSAVVTYRLDVRTWTHTFTAGDLDDAALAAALDAVGLRLDHWADDRRCWAVAVPAAQPTGTSPGSTTLA